MLATGQAKPANAAGPAGSAAQAPPPGNPAIRKRVRTKAIEGLNAARMKPKRPTYFMLCVGNVSCLIYLAPNVGASHKNLLRSLMGKDTGLKYHRGRCIFEKGYYIFVGPTVALGMRAKVERGLLDLTGRKWKARMRREEVPDGPATSVAELQS